MQSFVTGFNATWRQERIGPFENRSDHNIPFSIHKVFN